MSVAWFIEKVNRLVVSMKDALNNAFKIGFKLILNGKLDTIRGCFEGWLNLHPAPVGEEVLKEGGAPGVGDDVANLEGESI